MITTGENRRRFDSTDDTAQLRIEASETQTHTLNNSGGHFSIVFTTRIDDFMLTPLGWIIQNDTFGIEFGQMSGDFGNDKKLVPSGK